MMWKRMLTFMLCLLASLTVSASAAGERIEIANRNSAGGAFSCDVNLSGGQTRGDVFAVLFAESGQMKRVSVYSAKETVQVALQDVKDTDYIKILWTDANCMPLASPAVLRMSGNGAAAYAQFAKQLAALETPDVEPASAIENPYALARLLVSCSELPDLSQYGNVTTLAAPDNLYVLKFEDPGKAEQCAQYLQSLPSVRYVEPDAMLQADSAGTPVLLDGSEPLSWGVEETGIGEYSKSLQKQGVNRSVTVAVVDSGIDMNHPFLKGRLVAGYDLVEDDNVPQDEHGHGTHVAGTIVDCTPGMDVKIIPVRVFDAYNQGTYSTIANGIKRAVYNGANVINLSLSAKKHSFIIDDAVNFAFEAGVTVVVAAGNYRGNAKNACPAHIADCITVAAVDRNRERFDLSNYGDAVDIAAPGKDVNSSLPGGTYGTMEGTSMAAPHVSAAAALLMCERGTGQTPNQLSKLLKDVAGEISINENDDQWKIWNQIGETSFLGAGFLNMRPFIKYTVTFDANDGTGNMDALRVSSGESVTLTPNGFQSAGYTFQNWNTKPDGSGTSYNDKASLTVTADMTLYAQWKQDTPSEPIPVPLSWGTTATHMDEYAESLQKRGLSKQVIVAEIGSGVDLSHPFLQGRLVAGYDFVEQDDTPQDEHGHSTHVAGIIADCTPDNVKIMPVRVLNAFASGSIRAITSGIHYAVDHGANVICLPLSTRTQHAQVEEAIQRALSRNITVVVAAGNSNGDASNVCPAHIAECITVAAVDQNLKRFELSNYGEAVDIAAPGVDIYSCLPGGKYCIRDGTSMAAPHVSAAAAMLMCEYGTDLKPTEIADLLKNAAMPIPEDSEDTEWKTYQKAGHSWSEFLGAGFLDMSAFVKEKQVPFAMLYADGGMVFQNGNTPDPNRTLLQSYPIPVESASGQYAEWYSRRDKIQTVTFADTIQPLSTALWFYDCKNLTEVRGIANLDTSQVIDMNQMFSRCTKLETLDFIGLDTRNVTNMRQMFFQCTSLKTVYASYTFNVSQVTNSVDMFTGCTALVGGNGTKFDSGHVDKTYARIDGGTSAPGYFTRKS